MWDGGSRHVTESALALFKPNGELGRVIPRCRPQGKPYQGKRSQDKYSRWLPIRKSTLRVHGNMEAVAARVIQYAAEFRSDLHGRMTQLELAGAFGRTKQAISHQRNLMWDKVQAATGGRPDAPPSRGLRNIRRKGRRTAA